MRKTLCKLNKRIKKSNGLLVKVHINYWTEPLIDGVGNIDNSFKQNAMLAAKEPHKANKKYKYANMSRKDMEN